MNKSLAILALTALPVYASGVTYHAPMPSYHAPVPSYHASYHAPMVSYHGYFPSYHAPIPNNYGNPPAYGRYHRPSTFKDYGYHAGIPSHIIGEIPNGSPVRRYDGDPRMYADLDEEREVRKAGDLFLYYYGGNLYDGQGGLYNTDGTPLQPIGRLADGNLVYPNVFPEGIGRNRAFEAFRDGRPVTVIRLNNGHFAYDSFNQRQRHAHGGYREYFFDGQNWFDSNGNAW
ncbi:MAG: hypothetical protein LBJ78_04200 [Puniceicoccales bacterium]|nr:hypothetical protein [Puniceicoccales bacterium]